MTEEVDREKEIEETIELVSTLIDARVTSDRKDKIVEMLEGDLGSLYFTAPASSKDEYHYNWAGGLAKHSLNVYKNLRKLNEAFDQKFSEESMVIVALFHDLGKAAISTLDKPFYTPQTEDWKKKRGWTHEFTPDPFYMPTHVRSIFVLQHFGVVLKPNEFTAIYLNDGQYVDENKPYRLKECPLALMTHMADRLALEQEKK